MIGKQVISVTQLNTYIKSFLEGDRILSNLLVQGEISNFKKHIASGHMYFTLKDENSAISCVMFKGYGEQIKFDLENGLKIILGGRISIYEKTGNMQMYATDAQPDGIGALTLAYEQLKEKLLNEGLFDEKYKKTIPTFPKIIGIVTSKTGAVLHDMENVIKRRYPIAKILLYPVSVQGDKAPAEIVSGLEYMDKKNCDVIIVGRGGGSLEDLWAFNSEVVARNIFSLKTPVISAVGHETDFTIADFVADFRAPTPSVAAEIATPNKEELYTFFKKSISDQSYYINLKINRTLEGIDVLREGKGFSTISRRICDYIKILDAVVFQSKTYVNNKINSNNENYIKEISKLESLSPLAVLKRGYSIIENNYGIIDTIEKVKINDIINIRFSDGVLKSKVLDIINSKNIGEL